MRQRGGSKRRFFCGWLLLVACIWEAVQMKKVDLCRNRLHRNLKQKNKQAGSKFQMIFLICAEIGCVKIWVCPSALTSDTADTNMQLYFERKNGTQKYQDCIFSQVHVPCGRHCVGYCEFRFLMPKNDKNGPVSSILGAHKMCHFPHNRFLMWRFRAIFWNISILSIVV